MRRLLHLHAVLIFCMASLLASAQSGSGSSNDDPINGGTIVVGQSYSDTKPNTDYNLGPYWLAGDGITYVFTLQTAGVVNVSTCGSSLDTWVDVWSSNYSSYNDDNGPLCVGLNGSVQMYLEPGTFYVAIGANTGSPGNIALSVKSSEFEIDGVWHLTKDIEKDYTNGVITRDTTSNYSYGEFKLTLNQGTYTLWEDNVALDTGSYNYYNNQLVLNDHGEIIRYNVVTLDHAYEILILSKEDSFIDLTNKYREVLESHFTLTSF